MLYAFTQHGALVPVTVSQLDAQTFTSEFKFHWVPHLYSLVPDLN